jgi:hypothetical protein
MTDAEIMSLPEWDDAFDESIDQFKKQNSREPTLVELHNLIEILVNRFQTLGYLVKPTKKFSNG